MNLTRILVVDDSLTIRAMIETLLEREEGFRIVGIARNAEEAFELIADRDPDVVTLDVAMPGKNGMEILEEIMERDPRPVIMLSSLMREGDKMVDLARSKGALGCFNKSRIMQDAPKLLKMIRQAAAKRERFRDDPHYTEI